MATGNKPVKKIKVESSKADSPGESTGQKRNEGYHPLLTLREEVDELFDRFFSNVSFGRFGQFGKDIAEIEPLRQLEETFIRFGKMAPRADVSETDKSYKVEVELPGMGKDDIDISFVDDVITISGEKQEEKKEEKGNYHLSERRYGSVMRAFRVPAGVDAEGATASFKDGVLCVEMQKMTEMEKPAVRKIKISE